MNNIQYMNLCVKSGAYFSLITVNFVIICLLRQNYEFNNKIIQQSAIDIYGLLFDWSAIKSQQGIDERMAKDNTTVVVWTLLVGNTTICQYLSD